MQGDGIEDEEAEAELIVQRETLERLVSVTDIEDVIPPQQQLQRMSIVAGPLDKTRCDIDPLISS